MSKTRPPYTPELRRQMADLVRAELVLDAMEMAVGQRRPKDVIHHSDQGSQGGFNRLSQHGVF